MISIVTGTLNRKEFLPNLINNTVNTNKLLELVLVDGGSSDGTIEYIKQLNHSQIKLIEVGKRSSYPHFMNLGIQNSKYDLICQWNDDVLLVNSWDEIINSISDEYDFYLFNWKYGNVEGIQCQAWLEGFDYKQGWCLCDGYENGGEIVVNYGIYNKYIFKNIGLYNMQYNYYYADGDMSYRARSFGYKNKNLYDAKVCSIKTSKKAIKFNNDYAIYKNNLSLYKNKILPEEVCLLS